MTAQRWIAAAVAVAGVWILKSAAPLVAHHATSSFYDVNRKVETQGTVTKFLFRNPHAFLLLQRRRRKRGNNRVADRTGRPLESIQSGLDAGHTQAWHGDQGLGSALQS